MRYRSGWELLFMQHLDADRTIATYEYETLAIPYVSNARTGKVRRYFPDFLVTRRDGSKTLVEIKPKKRLTNRITQKKLVAAQLWCDANDTRLEIVTEDTLETLGLL